MLFLIILASVFSGYRQLIIAVIADYVDRVKLSLIRLFSLTYFKTVGWDEILSMV